MEPQIQTPAEIEDAFEIRNMHGVACKDLRSIQRLDERHFKVGALQPITWLQVTSSGSRRMIFAPITEVTVEGLCLLQRQMTSDAQPIIVGSLSALLKPHSGADAKAPRYVHATESIELSKLGTIRVAMIVVTPATLYATSTLWHPYAPAPFCSLPVSNIVDLLWPLPR